MVSQSIQDSITIATFITLIVGILAYGVKSLRSWMKHREVLEKEEVSVDKDISSINEFIRDCKTENRATRTTIETQGRILSSLGEKIIGLDEHGSKGVKAALDKIDRTMVGFTAQISGIASRLDTIERIVLNGSKKG